MCNNVIVGSVTCLPW